MCPVFVRPWNFGSTQFPFVGAAKPRRVCGKLKLVDFDRQCRNAWLENAPLQPSRRRPLRPTILRLALCHPPRPSALSKGTIPGTQRQTPRQRGSRAASALMAANQQNGGINVINVNDNLINDGVCCWDAC